MKTATGFEVNNPLELLIGFIRHWYPMYDGVKVPEDNMLRVIEIALSTMLNSRISGNTVGAIWRDVRMPVEEALAEIPPGIDLLDLSGDMPIPGRTGISQAVTEICSIPRSKLASRLKSCTRNVPESSQSSIA